MNQTSNIYKELLHEEVEAVVRSAHLAASEDSWTYSLLSGGLFNTTYLLKMKDDKQYVLRVAPIKPELLMDFEKTMMAAEPYIYSLLESKQIPVPRVIKMDDSKSVIPRSYILMERVEGVPLNHDSIPEEAREKLLVQLGGYIKNMHSIQHAKFGWPTSDGDVRGDECWSKFMHALVKEMTARLRNHQLVGEQELKQIERVYDSLRDAYDEVRQPSLVHNDLWDPNVLASQVNGEWKITAIIDVDRAMFADPEYEYVLWGEGKAIMQGYGHSLEGTPQAVLRRKSYHLMLCIMNTYVFAVEYDDQAAYEQSKQEITACLQTLKGAIT